MEKADFYPKDKRLLVVVDHNQQSMTASFTVRGNESRIPPYPG
jgi:hypothetical protein